MYKLLSTPLVPNMPGCTEITVHVTRLNEQDFLEKLALVQENYHGHEPTVALLREKFPALPPTRRGEFWDGDGDAIAARPKGGVRGGGDKPVTWEDLEFFEIWVGCKTQLEIRVSSNVKSAFTLLNFKTGESDVLSKFPIAYYDYIPQTPAMQNLYMKLEAVMPSIEAWKITIETYNDER